MLNSAYICFGKHMDDFCNGQSSISVFMTNMIHPNVYEGINIYKLSFPSHYVALFLYKDRHRNCHEMGNNQYSEENRIPTLVPE